MKFKDFNKIVKSYQIMANKCIRDGNPEAAKACSIIIEDLEYLFKLGYSNSLGSSKKRRKKLSGHNGGSV